MLRVELFGRLTVCYDDGEHASLDATKAQELFCFLLLNRNQPQSRELLASRLWGDSCTTAQSKKYLRKALWQLQVVLNRQEADVDIVSAAPDWIELRSVPELWLDVEAFEAAYETVKGTSGADLDDEHAAILEGGVHRYHGELLEGWFHDWCVCERERLHQMYMMMVEKLMMYEHVHDRHEAALLHGAAMLKRDPAHERAHRRMMRIYYDSGDRTGALRQYQRCVEALSDELDVAPARGTTELFEQIRDDAVPTDVPAASPSNMLQILARIERLQKGLGSMDRSLEKLTHIVEQFAHREAGSKNDRQRKNAPRVDSVTDQESLTA